MKLFILMFGMISSSFVARAYDCSGIKPFVPGGQQNVTVTVSRYVWSNGNASYEDVCTLSQSINWFDVRAREEEAYYCLKPLPAEVAICKTKLGADDAEIEVVPASWIRTWQPSPVREYRFHAYIVKQNDSGFYYDIFSRNLSFDLTPQNTIIEGSLKTGTSNPDDGFWIRLQFQN